MIDEERQTERERKRGGGEKEVKLRERERETETETQREREINSRSNGYTIQVFVLFCFSRVEVVIHMCCLLRRCYTVVYHPLPYRDPMKDQSVDSTKV